MQIQVFFILVEHMPIKYSVLLLALAYSSRSKWMLSQAITFRGLIPWSPFSFRNTQKLHSNPDRICLSFVWSHKSSVYNGFIQYVSFSIFSCKWNGADLHLVGFFFTKRRDFPSLDAEVSKRRLFLRIQGVCLKNTPNRLSFYVWIEHLKDF